MSSSNAGAGRFSTRAALLFVVVIFIAALLAVVVSSDSYGLHWDSTLFLRDSLRFANWFRSWVDGNGEVPPIGDIEYYFGRVHVQPPAYRILTGLAVALFGEWMGAVFAARLVSALAYALTVAGVFFLLRGNGWKTALVGALLFATFPRVFTFAHLHSVDMLMTCVFFFAVVSLPAILRKGRLAIPLLTLVYLAAYLTKVQGFLVPVVHVTWIGVEFALSRRPGRSPFPARRALILVIVSALSAFVLFLVFWPYMILDGFRGLREYVVYITGHGQLNVLYFGEVYGKGESPPWHYVLVMPAITMPVVSLILIVLGAARTVRTAWQGEGDRSSDRESKGDEAISSGGWERFFLVAIIVHLFIMALPTSPTHDGVRLLFMAYPFFALLGALGFQMLMRRIEGTRNFSETRDRGWRGTALVVAVVVLLSTEMAAFHPFQGIYYNQLVGGPGGAVRRGFDGDYLGIYAVHAYPFVNRRFDRGTVFFVSAANTGNCYGPAALSMRERDRNLALRPDLRMFNVPQRRHLVASRAPRFAFLGGRLAGYGQLEEDLAASQTPVYELDEFGVPIVRLYTLPNPEEGIDLPERPYLVFPYMSLLSLESGDGGKTWEALWGCREKSERPLAVAFSRVGSPRDPEGWEMFHHLSSSLSTLYWAPGDVVRAEYTFEEPIPAGEIQVAVFPLHSRPEEVHFLAAVTDNEATENGGAAEKD